MEVIRQAVRAHNFECTYASASTRDPLSQGIFYFKSDTPDTTVTESMAQPFVKSFMTGMGFVDTTLTMETPGGPPGTSHEIQPATSTFSHRLTFLGPMMPYCGGQTLAGPHPLVLPNSITYSLGHYIRQTKSDLDNSFATPRGISLTSPPHQE
jgi:hypothetical protein